MTLHPDVERLRTLREIESEPSLAEANEVGIEDMNEAELQVVILHDPDMHQRRAALRQLRLSILLDAELRIMRVLAECRR